PAGVAVFLPDIREQAALGLAIAETTLEATRARYDAGAATLADVLSAENTAANRRRELQQAEADLEDARLALARLVGDLGALAPVTDDNLLPAVELDPEAGAAGSARVRAAERQLAAAREQLAATDNALSSRVQVESARAQVEDAEEALAEARRSYADALRQAAAAVAAAEDRLAGARESLRLAELSLEAQRARLEAGTISRLAFDESRLSYLGALAGVDQARHALLRAQLQLRLALVQ
ncbi:MAG: TolC family protein, partial [Actinomycetes bacterium]